MTSFKIIDDIQEIRALQSDWQSLEAASDEPCFFVSWCWCGQIAEMMAHQNADYYRPLVAVATHEERITALWPLSLQKSMGLSTLCNLDAPFGQMTGILAESQAVANSLVGFAVQQLQDDRRADALFLEHVLMDSMLHKALYAGGILSSMKAGLETAVGAPVIEIKDFQDFESFQKSRKKKTRRNWRTEKNRLGRAGTVFHNVVKDRPEKIELMGKIMKSREDWLDRTGLTAPVFRIDGYKTILTGGEKWELQDLSIAFELLLDDQTIAGQWGFIHNDCYYAYISAMDLDKAGLAPGSIHLAYVIDAVIETGVERIELLTPASPYKVKWSDDTRQLLNVRQDLSLPGQLKGMVWDRTVRPMVKTVFYALPPSIRKSLMKSRE